MLGWFFCGPVVLGEKLLFLNSSMEGKIGEDENL